MTRRIIDGKTADWTPVEDVLARNLIADGRHDEVRLLHDVKATFDARPVEDDDCWHRERQAAAHTHRQEALI